MAAPEIEQLIRLLTKLPGLGPRSARRAALHLVKKKETALSPLLDALNRVHDTMDTCAICSNIDTQNPCHICSDPARSRKTICIVQDVADLWALERTGSFKGTYHVLGGVLSAIDGVGPTDLKIDSLLLRIENDQVEEVILATPATADGQTTAHYIADHLAPYPFVKVSGLAHGVPVGGELDYLDEGTLNAALKARKPV